MPKLEFFQAYQIRFWAGIFDTGDGEWGEELSHHPNELGDKKGATEIGKKKATVQDGDGNAGDMTDEKYRKERGR